MKGDYRLAPYSGPELGTRDQLKLAPFCLPEYATTEEEGAGIKKEPLNSAWQAPPPLLTLVPSQTGMN